VTNEENDMAEWTKNPTETGAYWVQDKGSDPGLAWMHKGNLFFTSPISHQEIDTVEYFAKEGAMFYGPLDPPPPCPAFRSNEERLKEALQELYDSQPLTDFDWWRETCAKVRDLLKELKPGE
jgi:hypothetical protein